MHHEDRKNVLHWYLKNLVSDLKIWLSYTKPCLAQFKFIVYFARTLRCMNILIEQGKW